MQNTRRSILIGNILAYVNIIAPIFFLAWVMKYCNYGFDLTDEGYYIVHIFGPEKYPAQIKFFGYFYEPFFSMVGRDIAYLRQLNVLFTFSVSTLLFYILINLDDLPQAKKGLQSISTPMAFSTASLVLMGVFTTPSYNSLALQACMVCTIGVLLSKYEATKSSIIGWILIGIGGWLLFLAKPSSAAALSLIVSIYIVASKKLNIYLTSVSISVALLLLYATAVYVDGNLDLFIIRFKTAIEFYSILGGGHTLAEIARLDSFDLTNGMLVLIFFFSAYFLFVNYLLNSKRQRMVSVGLLLAIVPAALVIMVSIEIIHPPVPKDRFRGLMLFSIPIVTLIFVLSHSRGLRSCSRQHITLAVFLALMPFVFAFGTNMNYWWYGSYAALFWIMSGLSVCPALLKDKNYEQTRALLAIITVGISTVIVLGGFSNPVRQNQPLYRQQSAVEIGESNSPLFLSNSFSKYVNDVKEVASKAGFISGTPILDLSGQSPGIVYAIGGWNISQPWMIGGLPGSNELASRSLEFVSCKDLASTWLIIEPGGPRSLSVSLLNDFGSSLEDDYAYSGNWKAAPGSGGYPAERTQYLVRPIGDKDDAIESCEAARARAGSGH